MTIAEIRAPDAHSDGTRSQVLRWLKRIGDPVLADEPLLELETDKVTVELASPAAGVLREISKGVDEAVAPSELLGRIETMAEAAASGVPAAAGLAVASAPPPPPLPAPRVRGLSPAVRRLLAEHHLDPGALTGTGLGGRITANDVLLRVRSPAPASLTIPAATRLAPHSPTRRRIAERMVQSLLHTAPHVTTVFEADLAAVLAHRARHRAAFERRGFPLTLTAYFARACVGAVRAVPEANARWHPDATEIHAQIDLGVAVGLGEHGLVVPVLRDVASLTLEDCARGLGDLTTRARAGRLLPADVQGGTFTLSNHGVSGSLIATPIIINQPQSAILGIGKLEKRVVVVERDGEDAIAIRPRCYVSLTIDHRVMDGERANLFLGTFVAGLEGPQD